MGSSVFPFKKVSIVELSSFLTSFDRTQVEVSLYVKVCMIDPMISCGCCLGSPNLTTKRCQHWHAYFKQFGQQFAFLGGAFGDSWWLVASWGLWRVGQPKEVYHSLLDQRLGQARVWLTCCLGQPRMCFTNLLGRLSAPFWDHLGLILKSF